MQRLQFAPSRYVLAASALILSLAAFSGRFQTIEAGPKRPSPNAEAAGGSQFAFLPTVRRAPRNVPTLNLPHFAGNLETEDDWGAKLIETGIFWFGQVGMADNYSDVRAAYDDDELLVHVSTFDRQLWYDNQNPTEATLTDWDSAQLYLDIDGLVHELPGPSSYRFTGQLHHNQPDDLYESVSQGDGSSWAAAVLNFDSDSGWRGSSLNSNSSNDSGWSMAFRVPFASLGLGGAPPEGTVWGVGVQVFDEDEGAGNPHTSKYWPSDFEPDSPASWARFRFGVPPQTAAQSAGQQPITIREGLNGANVIDGTVGGHTVCGGSGLVQPPMFANWGNTNYAGFHQINVMNQKDVADWPCFAKFFITFPLGSIPSGATILDATFTMFAFSHAGIGTPNPPQDSYLQVFTVFRPWDESTLTWNNAPQARENIAGAWHSPIIAPAPGVPVNWTITSAVTEAYQDGQPLHLAVYSADTAQNSGKYFYSSDTGEWNAAGRPTLTVVISTP